MRMMIADGQAICDFSNVNSFRKLYHGKELENHKAIDFNSKPARSASIDRACPIIIRINHKSKSQKRKITYDKPSFVAAGRLLH